MLLLEGKILPEEELPKNEAGAVEIEGFEEDFDYEKLHEIQFYWKLRFTNNPGIEAVFRKYKKLLMKAQENAATAGFDIFSAIYVMLDTGREEGFFKDHILFLLDGYHWSEAPCYAGEPYDITSANRFWRRLAFDGKEGYDTSPVSDSENFFLPRFTKDEWGTWFTVWLTQKDLSGLYNMFSIDFNADIVKKLLWKIFMMVGGIIIILTVMVAGIAKVLSGFVTRPITELTKGAAEVAHGNYDYEVPILKEDEFGELTKQFNLMTKGQKERLNLMETLEKFLSKELAEMAARQGIVLGGQKADCTVMFTDFAGFSTITQKMTAGEAVDVLNAYFGTLVPILKKYGGFPDKYIGDAIVALFGMPVAVENHAERAVMAAIEMQKKMREINAERRRKNEPFFEMRIGLNSGEVLVGAIGCNDKLEYTSIGETTNLANRMEAACPIAHIKITEGTYMKVRKIFFKGVAIAVTPDFVTVKGYTDPIATYSIYVDNLIIKKDMETKDIKKFYVYETSDAISIKNRPEDVPEVKFVSVAKFLDDKA
jgi:adenylate cyclase